MIIEKLKTNHIENPIGYRMDVLSLSWIVTEAKGNYVVESRVQVALDEMMTEIVYDSGIQEGIDSVNYVLNFVPEAGVRYFWHVEVWDDAGEHEVSEVAYFETAKEMKKALWIKAPFEKDIHPLIRKKIKLKHKPVKAMLYICGLGLYEAYLNGEKIGEEYLAPYCNDYNLWIQYQTYDLTQSIQEGENCLGVMLGNGWYKGRFGHVEHMGELYGDVLQMICELHLTFSDGSEQIIPSDESWICAPSPVMESSIYDGEIWDSRKEIHGWATAEGDEKDFVHALICEAGKKDILMPRLSLPVKIMGKIKPVELIHTVIDEWVLDFGQEITGWVRFLCDEPENTDIIFQFGEILQDGKFYNENLRTAKQEFHYISNGKRQWVRPHFTFFGFRYVKICGISDINLNNFEGCILHSEMDQTGTIRTSNPKVNRLIENALWGQKGNFLDVPTDCPKRDERMGWTGDAQVFSGTACFNMYTPAFYKKYLYDMELEQNMLGGSVPYVVPDILGQIERIQHYNDEKWKSTVVCTAHGSCAWGDAATVIPWNVYRSFGDVTLLTQQYHNMKSWVDYIRKNTEKSDNRYLWMQGFHFADWLALDSRHPETCLGATDPYFVASAYYYYSTVLTAKAAAVIKNNEDAIFYQQLAANIKEAFLKEYFTYTGRLAQETQTALALVLWLNLIPEGTRQRQVEALMQKLEEEKIHLTTGFVGTPILCPVLTENGHADAAYTLLLNEDFPSWLYEVNMGATTIWERWNSVLPDGKISGTGMNSLNHYAYGSIVEWMVRYMCGLNIQEDNPAYHKFIIRPYVDKRIDWVSMCYDSVRGRISCKWEKKEQGYLYSIEVPFDTEADFIVNNYADVVIVNGEKRDALNQGDTLHLTKGIHQIYLSC